MRERDSPITMVTKAASERPIASGTPAPEFTLTREDGSDFSRDDLIGKTTVLVFYPFAFSPVCTDQISLYEDVLSDYLAKRSVTMYGVSCDAHYSQTAFREKLGVSVPQLSDFEPGALSARRSASITLVDSRSARS
jgi:peroxiredoxin (alkyl hydroperoxide reductase subunit C)